jgi:hypothetical protein
VTTRAAATPLLVLHGVRLLGHGTDAAVAARMRLDAGTTTEVLEDCEAFGWVRRTAFAGPPGWSLTEAGRARNEALLGEDVDARGVRERVERVHEDFVALNARALDAFTRWQVRAIPGDALAPNDHRDAQWDDRVLDDLGSLGRRLVPLATTLTGLLPRCEGYDSRYAAALARAEQGERAWVAGLGVDSCHRVWFELHEDLVATLGLVRG